MDTTSRAESFSYQRNAGMSCTVPCRMPAWLTGVVHGTLAVHSVAWCEPLRIHREMFGRVPDLIPRSRTGYGTPSSWTKRTPGTVETGTVSLRRPAMRIA